jgi:hypothetical protein
VVNVLLQLLVVVDQRLEVYEMFSENAGDSKNMLKIFRMHRGHLCRRTLKNMLKISRMHSNNYIPLLDSWDSLSTRDDRCEDVTLHGDTKGEGNDVEKEEVSSLGRGGLSGEDTGLDSRTIGNSLIGVDALLELLATEEVTEELLDLGNTGGTTNKDDLVNLVLGNVGILHNLSNRVKGASESLLVQVLETSTGNVGVEVLAVE